MYYIYTGVGGDGRNPRRENNIGRTDDTYLHTMIYLDKKNKNGQLIRFRYIVVSSGTGNMALKGIHQATILAKYLITP